MSQFARVASDGLRRSGGRGGPSQADGLFFATTDGGKIFSQKRKILNLFGNTHDAEVRLGRSCTGATATIVLLTVKRALMLGSKRLCRDHNQADREE